MRYITTILIVLLFFPAAIFAEWELSSDAWEKVDGVSDAISAISSDKIEEGDTYVEAVDAGDGYIVFVEDGTEYFRITGGDFVFDDGTTHSPQAIFIGGTNDDTIEMFLLEHGTAGYSDLVLDLADAAGQSIFSVRNSSQGSIFSIGSDGKMILDNTFTTANPVNQVYSKLFLDNNSSSSIYKSGYFVAQTNDGGASATLVGVRGSSSDEGAETLGTSIGVQGDSTAGVTNYGVHGSASGGSNSIGVYGTASGASGNNWAGSFVGDVVVDGKLQVLDAEGAALMDEATSLNNPTVLPSKGDEDTGIGQNNADEVSIVTGGAESFRFSAGIARLVFDNLAYTTITQADAAGVTFDSVSDGTAGFTFSDDVVVNGTITTDPVALPSVNFYDVDGTDPDLNGQIYGDLTDTGSGTEDMDMFFQAQVAGSLDTFMSYTAATDIVTLHKNTTIGTGAVGVDYTLTFDGEDSDFVFTFDEDEASMKGNHSLAMIDDVPGGVGGVLMSVNTNATGTAMVAASSTNPPSDNVITMSWPTATDIGLINAQGGSLVLQTMGADNILFNVATVPTASVVTNGFQIGSGVTTVDYTLKFDGEDSDGTITWDEDNADFLFDNDISLGDGLATDKTLSFVADDTGTMHYDVGLNRFEFNAPLYTSSYIFALYNYTSGDIVDSTLTANRLFIDHDEIKSEGATDDGTNIWKIIPPEDPSVPISLSWSDAGIATFTGGNLEMSNAAGPAMLNEASTDNNATLIPNKAYLTTGLGGGVNYNSIVTNGTTVSRFYTGYQQVKSKLAYLGTAVTITDAGVAGLSNVSRFEVTTNGDGDQDNLTIADPISTWLIDGGILYITNTARGSAADSWKITPASFNDGTTIEFPATPNPGQSATLMWDTTSNAWSLLNTNGGAVDGADMPSATTDIVAASGVVAVSNKIIRIQSSTAGDSDISSNPQVVDGSDGQIVIFQGDDDTKTVTFDDGTGMALAGAVSVTLGKGDMLAVTYDAGDDLWYELYRSNN